MWIYYLWLCWLWWCRHGIQRALVIYIQSQRSPNRGDFFQKKDIQTERMSERRKLFQHLDLQDPKGRFPEFYGQHVWLHWLTKKCSLLFWYNLVWFTAIKSSESEHDNGSAISGLVFEKQHIHVCDTNLYGSY